MPKYQYKAKDENGKLVEGILDGGSETDLIKQLSAQGLYPISFDEVKAASLLIASGKGPSRKNVTLKDLYVFTSQLSNLLQGGLPLIRSLDVLEKQSPNAQLNQVLKKIISGIHDGNSFSSALAGFPKIFNSFYVGMVRSGEASGNLDKVLENVAEQLEKEHHLKVKVSQALVYPGIIVFVAVVTVFLVMTLVIPKMSLMYEELDQSLPLLTQILVGISSFVSRFWFLVLGLIAGAVFSIRSFFKKSFTDTKIGGLMFRLPLWGSIFLKEELVRFSKTFGMLLSGGVSLIESLRITGTVVQNAVFKEAIAKAETAVQQGTSFSQFFKSLNLFPMAVVQLISVGEETGALDHSLNRIAGIYEKELDQEIKMLLSLLEPLLILVIGVVIGIIAIGMFLPIFEISILN